MGCRSASIVQHQIAGRFILQLILAIPEVHKEPALIVIADASPQRNQVAWRRASAGIVHAQAAVLILYAEVAASQVMY